MAKVVAGLAVPTGVFVAAASGSWGLGALSVLGALVLALVVEVIDR